MYEQLVYSVDENLYSSTCTMYHVPGTWYEVYTCNGSAWMSAFAGTDISDRKVYLSVVVGKLKKGIALIMLIWRKSCLVIKHDYLLFKQVAVILSLIHI